MERISVYDNEANKIQHIAEDTNTTEPEVIEALFEALKDNGINIFDYL